MSIFSSGSGRHQLNSGKGASSAASRGRHSARREEPAPAVKRSPAVHHAGADRHPGAWLGCVWIPLSAVFMELVFRVFRIGTWSFQAVAVSAFFSLAFGFFLTFICLLGRKRFFRVCTAVFLGALAFYYGVQTVYNLIFQQYLGIGLVGVGGAAISDYWRDMFVGIAKSAHVIILLLLPLILWLVLARRISAPRAHLRVSLGMLILSLALQLGTGATVKASDSGTISLSFLYGDGFVLDTCVGRLGMLTSQRLDTQKYLSAKHVTLSDSPSETALAPSTPSPTPDETAMPTAGAIAEVTATPAPENEPQIMDIDFDSLIAGTTDSNVLELHEYFSEREPTCTNEYTGMFEGKNLIWICAEAFSTWAIDEERTPTLYALANSGFVFQDFYCQLTSASTCGGEFITLTGLVQNSSDWMLKKAYQNYMPFCMGNELKALSYTCNAYHDGHYTFYDRNMSHTNLGYEYFTPDHGLELDDGMVSSSDVAMMTVSLRDYIDEEPFNIYYMTISAHMPYTFANYWCKLYEDEVADLKDWTYAARAYAACQMELDRALEVLIDTLDEAGKLDDTVIVLSADHYPYALDTADIRSMTGEDMSGRFDLEHNTLILWCSEMEEPVYVDKCCSSSDILPTLLNLFGVEYDSRLLMGRDILSDSPGFVQFFDYSFLSDLGSYDAKTDTFTAAEGADVPENYVADTVKEIKHMYTYSYRVISYDYYGIVFGVR